ncbi:hypothetical protein AGR7B_Lc110042 [Agrobacterium deltaense RV3]|nr:hypothetical protein AGR7B_Lc110042 [Agrobacterium deltaense RV3]
MTIKYHIEKTHYFLIFTYSHPISMAGFPAKRGVQSRNFR